MVRVLLYHPFPWLHRMREYLVEGKSLMIPCSTFFMVEASALFISSLYSFQVVSPLLFRRDIEGNPMSSLKITIWQSLGMSLCANIISLMSLFEKVLSEFSAPI